VAGTAVCWGAAGAGIAVGNGAGACCGRFTSDFGAGAPANGLFKTLGEGAGTVGPVCFLLIGVVAGAGGIGGLLGPPNPLGRTMGAVPGFGEGDGTAVPLLRAIVAGAGGTTGRTAGGTGDGPRAAGLIGAVIGAGGIMGLPPCWPETAGLGAGATGVTDCIDAGAGAAGFKAAGAGAGAGAGAAPEALAAEA